MKKLIKFVLFVGALAGAAWALRDQLMPPPHSPSATPPAYRTPSSPTGADRPAPAPTDGGQDLRRVNGVGPVRVDQLAENGITTLAALADADAVDLAANLGVSVNQVEDWISQAAKLG